MNRLDAHNYALVTAILAGTNEMTLATIGPDGAPHATTVSFASDGLRLYAAIALDSQKAHAIRGDGRVSLTVNAPFREWDDIRGLSIDGIATMINEQAGQAAASELLLQKLPGYARLIGSAPSVPWPGMLFILIVPHALTLLDYTQRFGHSERFELSDLS